MMDEDKLMHGRNWARTGRAHIVCPRCRYSNKPTKYFCEKCRVRLRDGYMGAQY